MEEETAFLFRQCTDGAGINGSNRQGISPLHVAAAKGLASVVELLLKERAHVDHVDKETHVGWTPLMFAARNGHLPVVKILIENGADALHKNKLGASVVNAAVASGCAAVVKVILEECPKMELGANSEDICPLLTAGLYGHLEVIKLLLRYLTADFSDFSDGRGVSLVTIASAKNDDILSNFLLQNGANDNKQMFSTHSVKEEEMGGNGGRSGAIGAIASDLIEQYGWSLPQIPDCQRNAKEGVMPAMPAMLGRGVSQAESRVPVPPVSPYSCSYPQRALPTRSFKLSHSLSEGSVEREGLPEHLQHQCGQPKALEALGPGHLISLQNGKERERTCKTGGGVSSSSAQMHGIMKSPKPHLHQVPQTSFSLTNLLQNLNLENHICLFADQEIDMDTFLTLNHQDLQDIGVTSPNTQNKLLRVISAFRGQEHL